MNNKWIVTYRVAGFPGEQKSGPYDTWEIAEEHRLDIAGFEGVEGAACCVAPDEPAPVVVAD